MCPVSCCVTGRVAARASERPAGASAAAVCGSAPPAHLARATARQRARALLLLLLPTRAVRTRHARRKRWGASRSRGAPTRALPPTASSCSRVADAPPQLSTTARRETLLVSCLCHEIRVFTQCTS